MNLLETDSQCVSLLKRVNTHLAESIDALFKYDSHKFRTEHELLEDDINAFIKTFRDNRKDILPLQIT